MYDLINNIDEYPQFLNWCSHASILKQTDQQITASIKINKGSFNQCFTTINTLKKNQSINIYLQKGFFSHLSGSWIFTKLTNKACKTELKLQFNFASKLIDLTVSPIFTNIANSQLDAFIGRAKQIYG